MGADRGLSELQNPDQNTGWGGMWAVPAATGKLKATTPIHQYPGREVHRSIREKQPGLSNLNADISEPSAELKLRWRLW